MTKAVVPIQQALQSFIAQIDGILLTVSSLSGEEFISVSKDETVAPEDKFIVSGLAPSFQLVADQSSRLELGDVKHSTTWVGGRILLQMLVNIDKKILVSILLEENANLGLVDEQKNVLIKLLSQI